MPHVDDQFSGHMFNGDPRSPMTGAFGCMWPTIPAFRYRIQSNDATGRWAVWNGGGALVELSSPIAEHDNPLWELTGTPGPFEFVRWSKEAEASEFGGFIWQLWWKLRGDPLNILNHLPVDFGNCNVDVKLPDWSSGPSFPGSSGLTFRADQVVFNETQPPT